MNKEEEKYVHKAKHCEAHKGQSLPQELEEGPQRRLFILFFVGRRTKIQSNLVKKGKIFSACSVIL